MHPISRLRQTSVAGYWETRRKERRRSSASSGDRQHNRQNRGQRQRGRGGERGSDPTHQIQYHHTQPCSGTWVPRAHAAARLAHLGQRLGQGGQASKLSEKATKLPGARSRGRLPHHRAQLGSGTLSLPSCLRGTNTRIRDAVRVVPRYQSMMCEVGNRRGVIQGEEALDWRDRPAKIGRTSPRPPTCCSSEPWAWASGHIHSLDELQ